MLINLGQVVAHSVNNILVETLQLSGCVERADVKGEFLRAVEEELDAAQTRLLRLELETPFHSWFSSLGGIGRVAIGDLSRDFVRGDAIAAWPCLDDFYIIRGGSVHSSDTTMVSISFFVISFDTYPEKVVPKSTPTIKRSFRGVCSLTNSLTGPLIASVELGGV